MDAAFVKTGSHNEEVLPVDLDHNTLCCLSVTAEYFARILEFLESSLRDARFRIIQGSPKCLSLPHSSHLILPVLNL